jgi:tRNA G18 (ribose-2'-O)-methylase SpoU
MTDSATVEVDANRIPAAVQLRKDVKTAVEELQDRGEIRGRVKNQLVEKEIQRRAEMLAKALATREDLAREVNKIKPDNVTYNAHGEKQAELFSKKQADTLKKAKERLDKCDKAIDKCINKADYDALQKWQKGGSDDDGKKDNAE